MLRRPGVSSPKAVVCSPVLRRVPYQINAPVAGFGVDIGRAKYYLYK
jgi:hypothetical protein